LSAKEAVGVDSANSSGAIDGEIYQPSFGQERMWLTSTRQDARIYNMRRVLRVTESIDEALLERAIAAVLDRQDSLRTHFVRRDGALWQVVAPVSSVRPVIHRHDFTGLEQANRDRALRKVFEAAGERAFDLSAGPLFEVSLLHSHPDETHLLFVLHHIISDGWSLDVLVADLNAAYRALVAGEPPPPPLPVQYTEFARRQREALPEERLRRLLGHWRNSLAGMPKLIGLPLDRPRPTTGGGRGDVRRFNLGTPLLRELETTARRYRCTLFVALHAAFIVLLSRWSGDRDIVLGVPVSARDRTEFESIIGFFLNTLPLRVKVDDDPPFHVILQRCRDSLLSGLAHQDVPFDKLVDELQIDRAGGQAPIFQVMLNYQRHLQRKDDGPFHVVTVELDKRYSRLDLTLYIDELSDGRVDSYFEYSTELFDGSTLDRLGGQLRRVMAAVVRDPERPLSSIPLLSSDERCRALRDWNATAAPLPERTIHGLFADQARLRPDAVAIRCGERRATYAELDTWSDGIAARLVELGVRLEDRVAVRAERGIAAVAGILGTLKAGAVYVPLNSDHPVERQEFVIADSGAQVLIADDHQTGLSGVRTIRAEDAALRAGPPSGPARAGAAVHPDNAAYVIYTSGSTGKPKGVVVPHQAVLRLVCGANYADLGPDQIVMHLSSLSFDACKVEIWGPLLNGGTIAVVPPGGELLDSVPATIADAGVTLALLISPQFHLLVDHRLPGLLPLNQLLVGGDVVSPAHARRFLAAAPATRLVNVYGPTEATLFSTYFEVSADDIQNSVPIGRPISNTRTYILDDALEPAPVGSEGELFIGGPGLARGYLGQPGLTATRFMPDPFVAGERLYRTGDRGRYRPDGSVEFIGRADNQIQVRGYRVELGEIEEALAAQPGVAEACVVAIDDGATKRLAAFVTATAGSWIDTEKLRAALPARLPRYMFPEQIRTLPVLPLTSNDKIDREALAEEARRGPDRDGNIVRAATATERLVMAAWQAVLEPTAELSIHDKFFEVGGNSGLVVALYELLPPELRTGISFGELFEFTTVRTLAERLDKLGLRGQAPDNAIEGYEL